MSRKIKLETNDKRIHELERSLCEKSLTINDVLELSIGDDSTPIPLINVSSDTLERVIVWLKNHYLKDGKQSEDKTNFEEFDEQFFTSCDTPTLFRLLLAANYLNIKEMQTIGCKFAAKQVMNKTVDQIRQLWDISSDYSTEEDEELRLNTEWTER